MARPGITQEQVNATADALLRAGERPTVERVRSQLGTGSPNTLIRLLDDWWRQLGDRLHRVEAKLALPGAPEAVVDAASTLWTQALVAAEATVVARMAPEQAAIETARTVLAQDRLAMAEREAQHATELTGLRHQLSLAQSQLADAQALLTQQAQHLSDLQSQRESLQHQLAQLAGTLVAEQQHRTAQEAAHSAERDRAAKLLESVENRAFSDIDHAREEAKKLTSQVQAQQRERAQITRQLTLLQDDNAALKRALAAAEAKATALQSEVERVHDSLRTRHPAVKAKRAASAAKTNRNRPTSGTGRSRG